MVPPDTVMSLATKSDTDSLIAKVKVAVWPAASVERLLVSATVGGVVSISALAATTPSANLNDSTPVTTSTPFTVDDNVKTDDAAFHTTP